MFDVVARQTDRSDGNWGLIKGVARPKLTDNGYAMAPWEQRSFQSVFLEHHKGKSIPEVFLSPVEQFLERAEAGHSRLGEVLDDDALDALLRRARALVNARQLASS
jgi:hypothetical protein